MTIQKKRITFILLLVAATALLTTTALASTYTSTHTLNSGYVNLQKNNYSGLDASYGYWQSTNGTHVQIEAIHGVRSIFVNGYVS